MFKGKNLTIPIPGLIGVAGGYFAANTQFAAPSTVKAAARAAAPKDAACCDGAGRGQFVALQE